MFNIILTISKKNCINLNNNLKWFVPQNEVVFNKLTKYNYHYHQNNVIIMGENFWLNSEKKIFDNRINIIIRSNTYNHVRQQDNNDNLKFFDSLDNALNYYKKYKKFVIGCDELLNDIVNNENCEYIYLTRISKDLKCGKLINFDFNGKWKLIELSKTYSYDNTTYDFANFKQKNHCNNNDDNNDRLLCKLIDDYAPHEEYQYYDIIRDVIKNGKKKSDRTGVGTISKFGGQIRFDLSKSFPLLTSKNVFWRGVVEELLWFINGKTDSLILDRKNVKIWNGNGSREFLDLSGFNNRKVGDLGPIYGFQWRHFGAKYINKDTDYKGQGFDQLSWLINEIKTNPDSRRLILTAWNPTDLNKMVLPPCHIMAQFYVCGDKLSCMLYQRSCDIGLGVPFNIASYSLLTYIIAKECNLKPGEFIHTMGDMHIYNNHIDALKLQIDRIPNPFPYLSIKKYKELSEYTFDDFTMDNYYPNAKIHMEMAI